MILLTLISYKVKEGNNEILARFFSICGQLALKTLVFIETDVLSEINRQ